jgi:hypothetical protein
MAEAVTARQILHHLSPYDLDRVTFQMPDGLPVVAVYVDTGLDGSAVITISDQTPEENDEIWPPERLSKRLL